MNKESMLEVFGKTLVKLGEENDDIVVVDADLSKSTKTEYFKKTFPGRFIDVGIAEQNLMGVSAGLASTGKNVFSSSFAVFETGRAYEVIRNTVSIADLNVKICSTHAGITTGKDGGTHQSIEDIALMRVLPNMKVMVPADYIEVESMLHYMSSHKGPVYLRMVRGEVESFLPEDYRFRFGKAYMLREGSDLAIIACGPMVAESMKAAEILSERGIEAAVVNMSTIKPIDSEMIIKCAVETGRIVTVEDHSIIGGLGSAVCEVLCENHPAEVLRVGVKDRFGMSGEAQQLYREYGIDCESIAEKITDFLER